MYSRLGVHINHSLWPSVPKFTDLICSVHQDPSRQKVVSIWAYMVRNHQDGYPYLNFFLLLKIYRNINFFGKINWSVNSGWRWAGDSYGDQKNDCPFKTQQKMVTKLGQFTKLGPFSAFQLFKLSKLCYLFLLHFENENNFFFISLAIPCPSP